MTRAAAAGQRDVYDLDECGFAPPLPTASTWARVGTRVVVPYEAPQGRRVNTRGALSRGDAPRRLVWTSRQSGHGKLDSAALLDFICRDVAGLPTSWEALPADYADYVRARPCTIILDNSSVHRRRAVKAATPVLAQAGPRRGPGGRHLLLPATVQPGTEPDRAPLAPLWHQVKYHDLTQRSFADAQALHDAVDGVLTQHSTALQDAM